MSFLRLSTLLRLTCVGVTLLAAISASGAELSLVDDAGKTVTLTQPARRIISLAPSLTELVFAAGAGDRLVGVVEYSDYPEAATRLPLIGRFDRFDIEAIVALQPDLILAWQSGNPRATIDALERLGLTVYSAEPKFLDSIPEQLRRIGMLAGSSVAAETAATDFETRLATLESLYRERDSVRVFFQVWDRPLMTVGGNELTNDLITLCGGANVFAELGALAPKVGLEDVLLRDPEIIIASGIDDTRPAWLDAWSDWPSLSAVREGAITFVDPDLTQRHSPRVLLGAELLCERIDALRTRRGAN